MKVASQSHDTPMARARAVSRDGVGTLPSLRASMLYGLGAACAVLVGGLLVAAV